MKKYFITGLVILLPLAVTLAIITFLIKLFTKPFLGITYNLIKNIPGIQHGFLFFSEDQIIKYTSCIFILIFLFACTVALGFVARWFLLKAIIKLTDKILIKIPVVSTVYKTSKEVIKTVFASDKKSFQQVVMVPYPKEGSYSIGFISREAPSACAKELNKELITVLIPITPNPITGFLTLFEKKDIVYLDMKAEDAIKYVVSCGVIIPKNNEQIEPHNTDES
jgi:uncharacterized membrane protein